MTAILLGLIGVGLSVWLWAANLRARERALAACRAACRQIDVQLLDQTVVLVRMGLARANRGVPVITRYYGFEFSTDGVSRAKGRVVMRGDDVEYLHLDQPSGGTIFPGGRGSGQPLH